MPTELQNIASPQAVAAVWNTNVNEQPTYLYQVLLEDEVVNGTAVNVVFGKDQGLSVLDMVTEDASSTRMKNQGFREATYKLNQFKKHMLVDERTRRAVNDALARATSQYEQQAIVRTQLQDALKLFNNASVTREYLFTEGLVNGKIDFSKYPNASSNEIVDFFYDPEQFTTVDKDWGNKDSTPVDDVNNFTQKLSNDLGVAFKSAIMNRTTYNKLIHSGQIVNTLGVGVGSNNIALSNAQAESIFNDATGLNIMIYDKSIGGKKFIPDGKVVLVPDVEVQKIGSMAHTETQEQMGLAGNTGYDVATTTDGITVTTSVIDDPVGVKYQVSEVFLPLIKASNNVGVMTVLTGNDNGAKDVTPASTTTDNSANNSTDNKGGK
ncbi:hypothetical protein AKUH3B111A_08890 [Apilactobacillus kunkeei]|nr:hypothetical protein AKUH3B103M_08920 [Apilactobacillus kunkeei]CAI2614366.1 hypothetical protein AKUH3B104X_08920 [Apilactobacillus kunkeei]CAI2616889.1 hypothetical protein AKUH3B111A_08890 [Apilactobacillus kunkeei]